MTEFEQWYKDEYGVHPRDVVKDTPAFAQLQASRKAWEAGMVLVPWQTLDNACELLELHGEHEHPDYKALKATTSAKVKGVSDEQ